jgi:hypothetical protein
MATRKGNSTLPVGENPKKTTKGSAVVPTMGVIQDPFEYNPTAGTTRKLSQKYGKGSGKDLYNRALRAELPGGNILLDTIETLHLMQGRTLTKECRKFIGNYAAFLALIKSVMGEEINRRYSEPRWQGSIQKAVNDLEDDMKDRVQADTFDTANFVRNRLIDILKEMGAIGVETGMQ